jgi:hypothetical protein
MFQPSVETFVVKRRSKSGKECGPRIALGLRLGGEDLRLESWQLNDGTRIMAVE